MKLILDDSSKEVDSPNWSIVEMAIRDMNGQDRSQLGLFENNDCYLQLGGGGEDYVCAIRANGKLHVLTDTERSSANMKWIIVGDGADYPENECFPVEVAIDTTKWFWLNQIPSPQHSWVSY
jgi:hypothetical protein